MVNKKTPKHSVINAKNMVVSNNISDTSEEFIDFDFIDAEKIDGEGNKYRVIIHKSMPEDNSPMDEMTEEERMDLRKQIQDSMDCQKAETKYSFFKITEETISETIKTISALSKI